MMSNSFQFAFWILQFNYAYSLHKPETINEIEKNLKGKLKELTSIERLHACIPKLCGKSIYRQKDYHIVC